MIFSAVFAFIFATLYAVVLEKINPRPDYTWLTVVIGVALVLAIVGVQALFEPAIWPGLVAVGITFIAAGIPIIAWQWRRSVSWRDQVIERLRTRYGASRVADEGETSNSRD